MLYNGYKAIGYNGNMNLNSYKIFRGPPECFHLEMLLYPFKKELDLPTISVQQGNIFCFEIEVVCIIGERSFQFFGIIYDSTKIRWVVAFISFAGKSNRLITEYTIVSFEEIASINYLVGWFALFSDDEECTSLRDGEHSGEVKVASIKDITR